MRIAIALDWEETLAKTIWDGSSIKYQPRIWLKEFLIAINDFPDITMIGIFSLCIDVQVGIEHLEKWGFRSWSISKFHQNKVIKIGQWENETKDMDKVIIVDNDSYHLKIKPILGGFADRAVRIKVCEIDDDKGDSLSVALSNISEAIRASKIK